MMQTYAVTVPPGVGPGQQFQASLDGQLTMVIVPHGSGPNSTLHVQIPARPSSVQKYAVTIPSGVHPNGRFQANLGGQLVWLVCPANMGPGKQMLVDASSAASNGPTKTWPPPIGVPKEMDGGGLRLCLAPAAVGRPTPHAVCDPPHDVCALPLSPTPRTFHPQAPMCPSTFSAPSPAASCANQP
jgi:hypothetical protein